MPRITEECVARIKDSADIVSVVQRYIELRRAGYSWKACCPFHNEKTPSFHVNPTRQSFHCFGCGVGGDAVKFLMMYENIDYPTALRRLADMNGIAVIEEEENPELARQRRLRSRIIELNELAAQYYHQLLCRSQEAGHVREYLKKRGVNIEIAKAWQLGWAPPEFGTLRRMAETRGFPPRLLTDAYLLGQGGSGAYPVFRDRLMFPIRNVRGEVVGFSGRVMENDRDPRKYVNTSETAAFRKGELLFGLYKATSAIAKAGMSVVICEGQLDVIACHEKADIRNAVAGLGTAFTEGHARILAKYAKKATLCYDGDRAGIAASEKTFRKLAQAGLEVYQAELPPGEDPDSLISTRGAEALQHAIEHARPYLEIRVQQELALAQGDTNARAALIPRMADLAAEVADPVRRDVAVVDLATRLNLGLEAFRATVAQLLAERKKAPQRPAAQEAVYSEEEEMLQQEAEPAGVIPLALHPSIRGLISMAGSSEGAQALLIERIEELQEPIHHLPGGVILQRLLEVLPTPGDKQAWEAFAQELPPEQRLAIKGFEPEPYHTSAEQLLFYVDQACERAARDAMQAKLDLLRARIRSPHLEQEEITGIIQELNNLQKMLAAGPAAPLS
ncbi:MAG: DNA primase [Akkermansiaceae bacterium]|nr:DNA primase [Akkermansiaceae bacterium]